MISEPELVGSDDPGVRAEVPEAVTDDAAPEPRGARPWLWAAGGAAAASVVWAAGLYVHEASDPDTGDYRVSRDLCRDAELTAVGRVLGARQTPDSTFRDHPARSLATCSLGFAKAVEGGAERPSGVLIRYTLHRKTDPAPEFEASVETEMTMGLTPQDSLERVGGLGERAYAGKDGRDEFPSLHVLDGQAVLVLTLYPGVSGPEGSQRAVSLAGIEPHMIKDMRRLMSKLQD